MRHAVQPQSEVTPPTSDNDTGIFLLVYFWWNSGIHCYYIVPSLSPEAPTDEQQIALNVQVLKNRLRGRGGRRGGRGGRSMSGRESADSEYATSLLLFCYGLTFEDLVLTHR
jgi:hypothetical protein